MESVANSSLLPLGENDGLRSASAVSVTWTMSLPERVARYRSPPRMNTICLPSAETAGSRPRSMSRWRSLPSGWIEKIAAPLPPPTSKKILPLAPG